MSGNKGGFAVGISVVDQASAKLDAINKRLAGLSAPAERFNKSMKRFGDVTGITKAAEGMQAYGDRALGAARAVERLAGPLALLTSAGSLAGVAEMSSRWAQTGNSISKTSNLLRMPVEQLGTLRIAARIAGSSADALDTSLQGLSQTLSDAAYNRPGNKTGLLENVLGINPKAADGTAKTALDVFDKVADAVKARHADPSAQKLLLESLGMSPDLIPLLDKGAAGLAEFKQKAASTGGAATGKMVADARAMRSAWEELGATIEGVDNRIIDSWSGTITKVLAGTAHWIEKNKGLSDSIAGVGTQVMLLSSLAPAAWVLKLLGLSIAGAAGGTLAAAGAGLIAGEVSGGMQVPMVDDYGRVTGNWGGRDESANPAFIGNTSGVGEKIWNIFQFGSGRNFGTGTGGSPRLPGPRAAFLGGSGIGGALPADIEEEVRKNAIRDKLDPEHMVRLFRKEHGWGGPGYMGLSPAGARGPAQLMPGTADLMGVKPDSPWQDNVRGGVDYYAAQFARFGSYPGADAAYNAGPSGRGVQHFADTGDASQLPPETRDYVSSINGGAQNGHVTVDVNIKAPPGTTANTTSRGAVIARPALIEQSMPGVH